MHQQLGRSVGIVTNDQAADLVDTYQLRAQGFEVGEVAGSCFCCNFNELTSAVDRLSAAAPPDVVIAEPVGSCTDLVATVIQPLVHTFARTPSIAPYAVLLKPSHGRRILRGETSGGFSPKAAYVFLKQLEEADVIVLNRVDELSPAEADDLSALVDQRHPGVPILRTSAKTGAGVDGLFEFLEQTGEFGRRILDIDYDVYAEGEAELGWLNNNVQLAAAQPFDLDGLLISLIGELKNALAAATAETAHLKAIALTDQSYAVANLIAGDGAPTLSLASRAKPTQASLVINARVAADPQLLADLVEQSLQAACNVHGTGFEVRGSRHFRPGRPVPTHRIAAVV